MEKRSFTLIEILISITIITIFSGIILASYNGFTEDQKLKSESKRLISVLALARKSASAGLSTDVIDPMATCNVSGGYVFSGYNIVISTNKYELQRCCSSVCNTVHTYNFEKNITAKTAEEFLFQPLSLGAKTPQGQSNIITIKIKLRCIDITIGLSTFNESEIYGCS